MVKQERRSTVQMWLAQHELREVLAGTEDSNTRPSKP